MLNKEKFLSFSKRLFLFLLFIIPVNLGKHFEIIDSYVRGVLVDYLVPTVFLQDIVVFLILSLWFIGKSKDSVQKISNLFARKEIQVAILFIFSVFLSSINSSRIVPSLYACLRLFLYFLMFIYVLVEIPVEDYFFKIHKSLSLSILLVSVLGIFQFINKGSIFNNYLFLGEQPYSSVTFDVPKESFLGRVFVPSYGLFRHPNIFAGFLCLSLLWMYPFLKRSLSNLLAFFLGIVALFFTFSYTSWFVFILGVFLHHFLNKNPIQTLVRKKLAIVTTLIMCIFLAFIPLLGFLSKSDNPSILRRYNFLRASFRMIKDYPFFGVGFNYSTILIDDYNRESRDIRFTQPVHNIFLLIFSEAGLFSFLFFILFLYFSGKKLVNSSYFNLFFISFIQILILGSLDHYFITIHQTLLYFWIVLGLALQ